MIKIKIGSQWLAKLHFLMYKEGKNKIKLLPLHLKYKWKRYGTACKHRGFA